MKAFNKFTKPLFLAVVILAAFLASVTFPGTSQTKKFTSLSTILKQIKASAIQPALASNSHATNLGGVFRNMAFLIIGFPSDAVYNSLTGGGEDGPPKNGMIGLINDILGDNGVGQLLKPKYATCADLPSSGTESTTITEDGVSQSLTVTFSTPSSTIPERFTDAGSLYQKKLAIAMDDVTVFTYEFDCANTRGLALFNLPDSGSSTVFRKFKLAFQVVNQVVKADFGMYYNPDSEERFALRLDGAADGEYSMYMARVAKETNFDGFRASGKGNVSTGMMSGFFHMIKGHPSLANLAAATGASRIDTTQTLGMTNQNNLDLSFCYDYTAETAELGACSGLTLTAPDPAAAYPSAAGFSISNLASSSFVSSF